MPAPATTADFLDLVRRSRVIDKARLDAYLIDHAGDAQTPADLARDLRAAGLLTDFQTTQLLRGKHRGFVLGSYRLLDRIGSGGMGQVFLAEHGSLRRRAAIKVLPPDLAGNEFAKERFLREARAAAQLDHPNLVRAFDVCTEGEVIYLVMEYVEGISLHDLVTRFGPLDPARVGYYLWQVAAGLASVHAAGLVHRDVKPANLMVDRTGTAKILDLGLVRSQFDDNELTRGQGVKILGTADFLAPEQAIDCSTVDARADVYSLGATGYFLLAGQVPFPGDKVAQKLIAHQTVPAPRAAATRPGVPTALSDIVAKMMAKNPADRYQTAAEVATALEPWAVAPPPPPAEEEIPIRCGGTGGPGSMVLLGSRPPRSAAAPYSGLGLQGPGSGSAVRYQGDSGVRVGSPSSGRLLPLAPLTPVPSARPAAAVAAAPVGVAAAPPVLPAARTHLLTADPMSGTPHPGVFNPFRTAAAASAPSAPVSRPKPARRRASVAVAWLVVAGVGAWDVVLLNQAVARSSVRVAAVKNDFPANHPAEVADPTDLTD